MNASHPNPSSHKKSFRRQRRERRRKLRRSRMVRVIPSLFTIGNLLCGFAAIFCASRYPELDRLRTDRGEEFVPTLMIGASLVFVGMVLDTLDGHIARLTRQTSDLGEQLDSMSDMVTFGVAPAFLMVQLVGIGLPVFGETLPRWDLYFERFVLIVAAVYVACAALRLARFNIELEQPGGSDHMNFKGLPTPAAAGTVCSLVLLQQWFVGRQTPDVDLEFIRDWARITEVAMVFITLLSAIAMISMVRYPHVANRLLRERAPVQYLGGILFILIPLFTYPQATLAIAFTGFAVWGPISMMVRHKKKPKKSDNADSNQGHAPMKHNHN